MKKVKVVQFDPHCGARIFINPENLEELRNRSDCLVDPDLREVQKVPTCFWKRKGHAAVPMDDYEMEEVRANFEALGAPFTRPELKRLRSTFLSKNLFHRFLAREREDFQFLIMHEANIAKRAFFELEKKIHGNQKEMESLVKDSISNFLDIYTSGFVEQMIRAQAYAYNRVCYKFNIIIFLFLSIIILGVIRVSIF